MMRNAGTFTVRRGTSFSSQAGCTPARSGAASSARTVPRSDPIATSPAGTSTRLSSIRASTRATSMPDSLFVATAGPARSRLPESLAARRPGRPSVVGRNPSYVLRPPTSAG